MRQNYNSIFKKFSYKIYQFSKIRKFLNTETRILVYKQTILPLAEYVSFVLCLNNKHDVDKLQKLQNRALRMCYNIYNPRVISIGRLHEMAKIDLLYKRRMMQLLGIMYDNRIDYQTNRVATYNTRQTEKNNFDIKRANVELYSKSPYCIGSKIWNDFPKKTQDIGSKKNFIRTIKDLI